MMHLNDTTSPVKGQHLTLSERIEIQSWKRLDKSNRFIAKELGRSHRSITYEIKRGTTVQKRLVNRKEIFLEAYSTETDQLIYEKHREACKPRYKLLKVEGFIKNAKQKIQSDKWSPDIIVWSRYGPGGKQYQSLAGHRQAIHGRCLIIIDGGIRTGSDVFKALALGADAVLIGRPFSHASIGSGKEGVVHLAERLTRELKDAMMLTQCASISDIDESKVVGRW